MEHEGNISITGGSNITAGCGGNIKIIGPICSQETHKLVLPRGLIPIKHKLKISRPAFTTPELGEDERIDVLEYSIHNVVLGETRSHKQKNCLGVSWYWKYPKEILGIKFSEDYLQKAIQPCTWATIEVTEYLESFDFVAWDEQQDKKDHEEEIK